MDDDRTAGERLANELEEKSRRIRELELALEDRDRRESARIAEASRLAQALRRASLRAWFWSYETRLTHYLPAGGEAPDPRGEPTQGDPVPEDRLLQRMHPEDRERVALAWTRAHESRAAYGIEYRLVGRDGATRYQRETSTPEFDEADRYLGQVGVTEDITERRLADEELRRSEQRLVEAERVAGFGHWKWSDEGDRMILCSEQAAEIFGLTPEEFLARSSTHEGFLQLVHEEDRKLVDDSVRAYYDSFHGDPANAGALEIEYRIVRADGAIRHIRELAGPTVDERGATSRSVGTVFDVTDLRQAEEEVRTRDAWLRAIMEKAPIEIVLKDTEGRIIAVSRATAESFGVEVSDCVGRTTADFLPPRLAEAYMAADRKVVETGQPSQQEIAEEVDGKTRHSLNAKFPLRDDGGRIVGVCSITNDITDMKDMQAQLFEAQKMEAVGQLTGGVAHDFNNLLAAIIGNTELLGEEAEYEDESLQAILKAATRGAELTHRLLAFSRRQFLRTKPIDIAALVGGLSDLLVRSLGETVEIALVGGPGLWTASADPGQVENAILNLAINGRDAMPRGGKLTIECRNAQLDEAYVARNPEAIAGDYVVLAVSDTGTGMSKEVRAHAFEPFFTTKEVGAGSGLGLSMVYGFAKQSGGHVEILSEDGAGTTVKLYLPRAATAPAVEAERAEEAPQGRGETVLVIEDEPEVRTLAARMLRSLDYRVIDVAEAADARTALANDERVDVMLTDVVLSGGMSGPEFAAEARGRTPGLKVIFMSGYPAETATRHGYLGSGEVLLNKPFQRVLLAKALRQALD